MFSSAKGFTTFVRQGIQDLKWSGLAAAFMAGGMALSAAAAEPPKPKLLVEGLKNPESVAVSPEGRIFVSEIGAFDKNGDGTVVEIVDGKAKTIAKGLDDPKGLDCYKGLLFVADKQRVWKIDAAGKMSAALACDNQQAASELKSRAGELQRALEQAGFDLSGGLSFDLAGQGGQGAPQQSQDNSAPVFRGRAFQTVLDGGADSPVQAQTYTRAASASGVDIRI